MCYMYYEQLKDDDEFKKKWIIDSEKYKDTNPPYTSYCFSSYQFHYQGKPEDGEFYFGFYADEKIELLLEESNNKFKNIQVELMHNAEYLWRGGQFYPLKNYRSIWTPDIYTFYIFKVKLNKEYSQLSNFMLTLTVAQFFRVMCPEYKHYLSIKDIEKSFITNSLKAFNNTNGVYGSLGGSQWKLEEFMSIDNIEFMNSINIEDENFGLKWMPANSRLLQRIRKNWKNYETT